MRILLVEDEDPVAKALARLLRQAGHEVLIAETAIEAIRVLVVEKDLGCVLLDVNLGDGELSGLHVAQVKHDMSPEIRDVPVIIVSGLSEEDIKERARQNALRGTTLLCPKPVDTAYLLRILASFDRPRSNT